MVNLAKIQQIFENYAISDNQLNNSSLDYMLKDIKKFASEEETKAVEDIFQNYRNSEIIQINNFSFYKIYDEIENSILLNYELLSYL
jgi:hypothetical protein